MTDLTSLLRAHPVIDGHNDLPWEARERVGYDFDRLDIAPARTPSHTDIPAPPRGRASAASSGRSTSPATSPSRAARDATLEQIDLVHRMIARYPDGFALADHGRRRRAACARRAGSPR